MNIQQAKSIRLCVLLDKLGREPEKQRGYNYWYLSPFRKEKTASFHVKGDENIWYDFGEGKGGTVIDFACLYLERSGEHHTVADALRWIKNMAGIGFTDFRPIEDFQEEPKVDKLTIKSIKPIAHPALTEYLSKRRISLPIAKQYLKEARVKNHHTKKHFFALSFANEDGGYELRNPFFKGSIAPKTITFIRGCKSKPETIHLFEGFMDFLSAIKYQPDEAFEGDTIVLNSLSNIKHALPFIKSYGYRSLCTWMDNDPAGEKATALLAEFAKTEEGLRHVPMNGTYLPHKDVNAWHVSSPTP